MAKGQRQERHWTNSNQETGGKKKKRRLKVQRSWTPGSLGEWARGIPKTACLQNGTSRMFKSGIEVGPIDDNWKEPLWVLELLALDLFRLGGCTEPRWGCATNRAAEVPVTPPPNHDPTPPHHKNADPPLPTPTPTVTHPHTPHRVTPPQHPRPKAPQTSKRHRGPPTAEEPPRPHVRHPPPLQGN